MELDNLKFSDAIKLMNELDAIKNNMLNPRSAVDYNEAQHPYIGKYVLIRTYAAGVHVGVLKSYDATTRHAFLTDSRRIWSWEGAFTLSAVATDGITGGKVAMPLAELMITQVEEIIPCTALSEKILRGKEIHKP